MTDAEKLSLAYQLQAQDPATYPAVSDALAKIEADALAMQPAPPAPSDVVQYRHLKAADGTNIEHVEILGDGTERPVVA